MNLKEKVERIQNEYNMSFKEARHMLKASVRKMYENGVIDKAQWKNIKKYIDKELK